MKIKVPFVFVILSIIVFAVFTVSSKKVERKALTGGDFSGSEKEIRSEAWDALQFISTGRAFPGKDIPEDGYERAYRFYKNNFCSDALRSSAILTNSTWQSIGPNNIGGRTLGIAIDPNDTSIIWLGSASGGLWKSTSGGIGFNAWTYVPTGFPVRGVSCIAIDPSNSNIIYIGTGETYSYGTSVNGLVTRPTRGTVGIGILKTTDGGVTWTQSLNWNYNQLRGIWDIMINPLNPAIIYAATTEGVYKTEDAGASWTNVLNEQMVMDLEIDRVDTNIVYACVGNVTSANKGLYKTSNSGLSWTHLTNGLPPGTNQGRITVTAYPGNNKILYALVADLYSTVGVYQSVDEGLTWNAMNNTGTEIVSYQGWYAKGLCVKSNDSSKVLFGGVEIFKSDSSGNHVSQVTNINGVTDFIHPDVHEIVFNPLNSNKIYVLTDGGLYRSNDFGNTYYECTDGYVTSQFYIGSTSYQDSLYIVGGAQDNNTNVYTGSVYWQPTIGGDGTFNAIDPTNDQIQFAAYQYLNILGTTDGGFNWFQSFLSPASPLGGNPSAFVAPFILCPSNPSVLYAGSNALNKTSDGGIVWTNPHVALADTGKVILTIAVSATNSDSVYFATAPTDTTHMHVFRSVNGGINYTNITAGLPNRYPRQLTVNPADSREVYLVYSGFGAGHVFKTTNGGGTWTDISAALPDVPFHTLMVDPLHTNSIYAGSDLGVFASDDGGANWIALNNGLPEGVMVFDLVYSPSDNAMIAFTHGNGVYKISMIGLPLSVDQHTFVQQFTQQIISNPARSSIQLSLNAGKSGKAMIALYDVNGKKAMSVQTRTLSPGINLIPLDAGGLTNGTYFLETEFAGERKTSKFVVLN